MSFLKKMISAFLVLALTVSVLCSCGESYKDAYIYFELLEQPKTLDPQTASSDSELLVVRNIYEGLLRRDFEGNIVNGVCESYTYSKLTYTFKLKHDIVWSDGTPLTAHDFVYGFRRAVDPKINAPFASRLFAIKNAKSIASGEAKVSTLGVKAVDDYTLTITLSYEDENFTDTLTTSVCMPCNEQFFEDSIGKYGLDADHIISNGSYRLAKWNKDDFGMRLYKNEEYTGEFETQNAAVFISCVDDEAQVLRLSDGDSDMAFITCGELDSAQAAGLKNIGVENICWFLTLSRDYSPEVRRAFAAAFSADVYSGSLSDGFTAARSIYPQILGINTDGVGLTEYNINEAKSTMSAQIADMKDSKFPTSMLYYYDTDNAKQLATSIVGHWQQNLSTFINIQPSTNISALQNEISHSELDFALFPVKVTGNTLAEYARNFKSVSTADTAKKLQRELCKSNTIIPVAHQSTNICYIPTLENVVMEKFNGYIDFSYIIKR